MKEIIEILMNRDSLTYEAAKEAYYDCKSEIMDALDGTSCVSPVDILQDELGLEPDYILNFL